MNRIQKAFDEKKKVFIGFVTAGDPNLATTKELVRAMIKGGAGLIEFGIPFSDPVAEGEVIQKADMRALAAGTTTDKIFDLVAELREETQVPLVFLTYANPIYAYGAEKFFTRCEETGVDGVIIPDIPYEEREEMRPFSEPHHVALVPLIAPTSKDRIQKIAAVAKDTIVYHTTYFNHIKQWIKREESCDVIEGIFYGIKLPDDLQKSFVAIVAE